MHGIEFTWQPRFHDRIIRSEKELMNIRRDIHDNPKNWGRNEAVQKVSIVVILIRRQAEKDLNVLKMRLLSASWRIVRRALHCVANDKNA